MTNEQTDWRALSAELVEKIEYTWGDIPEDVYELLDRVRDLLAQPELVTPTDEEIGEWQSHCAYLTRPAACGGAGVGDHYWAFDVECDHVASIVRAALTRWGRPTIEPVPVAERLPGPDDLDDQGTCWMFHPVNLHYCLCRPDPSVHTHWLPHHAMPVPSAEVG
jgi:hypothetical protein